MRARRINYFLSHTFGLVTCSSALICALVAACVCATSSMSVLSVAWLSCVVLLALPVGWLCGFLVFACLGPEIHRSVTRINGGPFRPGDRVCILAGRHRDEIGKIVSISDYGVRVTLEGRVHGSYDEHFPHLQIMRV